MKTSWNDEEDEALQGLPLRAQIIYLRGIRRYMNYSTGIAGNSSRRISLKSLAEVSESFNNRQVDQPTKNATRASIEQLKKSGLIERIEDKDYLIFFLPKADRNDSVQNNYNTTTTQQQHNNNTDSNTEETINYGDLNDNYNIGEKDEILQGSLTTTHIRITGKQVTEISKDIVAHATGDVVKITKNQPTPYQAIVDLYHETLPGLSQVYKLTDQRKQKIRALWADELDDLNCWKNYFISISHSDFLMGRSPPTNGRSFIADLDFIINPTNFVKIAEEKYHGKKVQARRI